MIYVFLGYMALYAVIWQHEIGHSIMYAVYGCKENAFKVSVPFYLAFSTPAPVDLVKIKSLNKRQHFFIAMAGIVVNLLFGLAGLVLIRYVPFNRDSMIYFIVYTFTLFHFVEAASYMVLNNIYVASDIISIQNYRPIYRVPTFIVGTLALWVIVILLSNSQDTWKNGLIYASIAISLAMGLLRVLFNILSKKRN